MTIKCHIAVNRRSRAARRLRLACMPHVAFSHYNLGAPRSLRKELQRFYCDVVGLELRERAAFSSFGHWLFAGASDVLHLTETRLGDSCGGGPARTRGVGASE